VWKMEERVAELEDKVLLRSGEELLLEQMIDRFTVMLPSQSLEPYSLEQLSTHLRETLDAEVIQYLPVLPARTLVELRVVPEQLENAMQMARELQPVQFASPVYWMQRNPDIPVYLTHQLTVQFIETADTGTMQSIANSLGLQIVKLVPGIAKAFVFELTQRATANPLKLTQELVRHSQVLMAEPNVVVPIQHDCLPLTMSQGNSFSLEQSEQSEQPEQLEQSEQPEQPSQVQNPIEAAWSLTQGDRSIAIAVTERTIDWQQLNLHGFGKIVAPLQLSKVQQPAKINQPGKSQTAPGSKVQLLSEIAPDCALMPIEIGDWLDDQLIEQICQWAIEQEASILVCAWGAKATYFPLSLRQRAALSRLATYGRHGKGCLVVVAENDASKTDLLPTQESSDAQNSAAWLNGFVVHPDVMPVASDNSDPIIPSGNSVGLAVWATNKSGTGEASAIVAAVAALMLSVNPDLTSRAVKQILQDTADRPARSELMSQSSNDIDERHGYSHQVGYGKINAWKAVDAARQRLTPREIPDRWIEQHNATALAIPDGDSNGVCSAIEVVDRGVIKQVEISLEIAHSFMGDLEIYLIAPKGKLILLQSRTLGRIKLLRKTYNFETTPYLKTLLHQPVTGRWQIKVVDRVVLNTGQLQQWQLKLGVESYTQQ